MTAWNNSQCATIQTSAWNDHLRSEDSAAAIRASFTDIKMFSKKRFLLLFSCFDINWQNTTDKCEFFYTLNKSWLKSLQEETRIQKTTWMQLFFNWSSFNYNIRSGFRFLNNWDFVTSYLFISSRRYQRTVHQLCSPAHCLSQEYGTVLMESR